MGELRRDPGIRSDALGRRAHLRKIRAMSDSQIALVTGGTGGIGRAIALALATEGAAVAVTGRNPDRLAAVGADLEARGVAHLEVAADLRSPDAAADILGQVTRALGAPTILVNNAGTAPTAKFERSDDALLDEVLDLHVRAPFRLIREALPAMRARGAGTIVQLGSSAGLRGYAFTSAYTAAKHGMVGMTRALALELAGSGVATYAVCPGFVDTDITRGAADAIAARGKQSAAEAMQAMASLNKIGRMLNPDEVGAAVAFLCREHPTGGCVYDLDTEPPQLLPEAQA